MTIHLLSGPADALWRRHDALIVDLDGVVYVGSQPVEHAVEVLSLLVQEGCPIFFATNNASHTADQVAERLRRFGLDVEPGSVITSSDACADYIHATLTPGASIRVIGAEGIRTRLQSMDFTVICGADEPDTRCDVVIQGHSPATTWLDLAIGFRSINSGAVWIATNMDLTIPLEGGLAPGNGALVSALAVAAGRPPDVVIGKPHQPMFDAFLSRSSARTPLVIGDRRDTDIAWANAVGCASLQVGTGVDSIDDAVIRADERPTYIAADLRGLLATPVPAPVPA